MKTNPLHMLSACGQSLWLDYISRELIDSGELKRLIEEDGLRGMTSNPTIFEEAVSKSSAYDDQIRELASHGKSVSEICTAITIEDVRRCADEFKPLYEKTGGQDGFVSLEANPHLAHDTNGTIQEARTLWAALSRPNVFIKVPATTEGIPAIQQLISEGINVNVTLLFGLGRYRQVAEAYVAALETRAARGEALGVSSVASFFVSRIDTKLDAKFEALSAGSGEPAALAREFHGQVAVANAKLAYQMHKEIFGTRRFWELTKKDARKQRLLWASTGTKNPAFSDIKYIEELIGPETVNTVPLHALAAYRGHGKPEIRIEQKVDHAAWVLEVLPMLGINMEDTTRELEEEGARKFSRSFDDLLKAVELAVQKRHSRAA